MNISKFRILTDSPAPVCGGKPLVFGEKKAARRPLKVRQAASCSPSAAPGIPAIQTGHAPVEEDEGRGVALGAQLSALGKISVDKRVGLPVLLDKFCTFFFNHPELMLVEADLSEQPDFL